MAKVEPLTRGGSFGAYVEALRAARALDTVLDRIAPETRPLLVNVPATTEWLPLRHNVNLFVAYDSFAGAEGVRRLAYEAGRAGLGEQARPVVELALGTFGPSPATIFSRADLLLRFSIRGQKVTYNGWGSTGGAIEFRVMGLRPPPVFFEAWAGIVAYVVELCGKTGTARVSATHTDGDDGIGSVVVSWR
jgi:hypothetical protein